jgi:two-component system sensor histidine kinase KdpD
VDTVLMQWDRLDDDAKQDLLRRTSWNARELRRLIEQVLAFSALDAAESPSDLGAYALASGVGELVHHMAPALRDCPVEVDIDDELLVLTNAETIHHVLGNLLTNASKFSPAGSPIRIVGRRDGDLARISVTDRGPGIPSEDQERIFERFYRGSTTRTTRGTGIGLAIVKATLEAVGGTVSVRSTVGEGSVFEVTLRLAAGDSGGEAVVLDPVAPLAATG